MIKILFRKSYSDEEEYYACNYTFGKSKVVENRTDIKSGDFVVPRYSALPFYKELEADCNNLGGRLINSYNQHRWIADFKWYSIEELAALTFKSYTHEEFLDAPQGEYVVKGATNSKKWNWNTAMKASNKREAIKIGCDLMSDSLIGTQNIIYREYIPLKVYEKGINGLPFAEEWRFFFFSDILIDYGYYWSIAENVPLKSNCPAPIIELSKEISKICSQYVNFFVLDIALTDDGRPILVEINDGSMSGLSSINPLNFYFSLNEALTNELQTSQTT